MDPRLLRYYNQEMQHLHEMGAEFAQQFPKIAARLGMDGIEVTDPYVERLLEGVGFAVELLAWASGFGAMLINAFTRWQARRPFRGGAVTNQV